MPGHGLRVRRGVRLTIALASAGTVAVITTSMFAFAAPSATLKKVPPRDAAKATEAAQVKKPEAQSPTPTQWGAIASKVVAIAPGGVVVTGLSLQAGTFSLSAAGSLWTTSGQGPQSVGCHLMVGKESYADAYVSVDTSTVTQQSYALIGAVKVTAPTTVQVLCNVGKSPADQVSTQANLVTVKLG
jgi:hypothetical protein